MSDYNPDRRRDPTDIEAITSSRFLQTPNQESDENEDEEEINPMPINTTKKTKTTSILKNSSTRPPKPRASSHISRLQSYHNNDDYDHEDFEEDDADDTLEDSQNEIDEENEKFSLAHHQSYNRNGHQQKTVKIMTRSEKVSTGNGQRGAHSSSSAPQQHSAFKNSKYPTSGSGYEMNVNDKVDIWGQILIVLSYLFLIFTFPFSLCACVKVAQEYERAVIFRLGRILPGGAKGPGIFFVLPCIDTYTKVDLRTVTFDVPPQEILTKDSVTVSVDAVVYFRILNAVISVINVEDAAKSTKLLAASTLRNILGTKSLHEILSDRESVAILIQNNLDDATGPWGVKVERVEVKDVRLPVQLQRAMATEAEAAREARAKVIAAEGEQKASRALKEAAIIISESPIAIQLRYLQTLTQIASEKNSTIVFPIPLEMFSFLANKTASLFNQNQNS